LRIDAGPVFRCEEPGCHEGFPQKDKLIKHQERHAKPSKCPVPECEYSKTRFALRKDLDRHQRSKHRSHGSELLCPDPKCKRAKLGKGWPRRDNLLRHV
ncbi:uncharacterized protein BDZ99DRAFT_569067, partial [Mytilinidion resinicola]